MWMRCPTDGAPLPIDERLFLGKRRDRECNCEVAPIATVAPFPNATFYGDTADLCNGWYSTESPESDFGRRETTPGIGGPADQGLRLRDDRRVPDTHSERLLTPRPRQCRTRRSGSQIAERVGTACALAIRRSYRLQGKDRLHRPRTLCQTFSGRRQHRDELLICRDGSR